MQEVFPAIALKAVCPVFQDALKPEPLLVEPSRVPGQRTTKSIYPTGQYWYSQGTPPQTIIPSSPEPLSVKPLGFPHHKIHTSHKPFQPDAGYYPGKVTKSGIVE